MHYMIITIAQNITLNTCTTVAINNQYTVPRVNFHIFLVLFLLKVQTTRTDSTKIQKKIYTTNKKLPVSKTFKLTEPI